MAKIGNETKLVLKLAAERAKKVPPSNMPRSFLNDEGLKEAWELGTRDGIILVKSTLDTIVFELEDR